MITFIQMKFLQFFMVQYFLYIFFSLLPVFPVIFVPIDFSVFSCCALLNFFYFINSFSM